MTSDTYRQIVDVREIDLKPLRMGLGTLHSWLGELASSSLIVNSVQHRATALAADTSIQSKFIGDLCQYPLTSAELHAGGFISLEGLTNKDFRTYQDAVRALIDPMSLHQGIIRIPPAVDMVTNPNLPGFVRAYIELLQKNIRIDNGRVYALTATWTEV